MKKLQSLTGAATGLFLMAGGLMVSATSAKATTENQFFTQNGFTEDWAVYEDTLGTQSAQNVQVQNGATVTGDMGIGDGENVQFQQSNTTVGAVTFNTQDPPQQYQDQGAVVGATYHRNLTKDNQAFQNVSGNYSKLVNQGTYISSNPSESSMLNSGTQNGQLNLNNGQQLTLTAGTSPVVFNIGQFSINNNSSLDLQGSANSEFVFNIYNGMQVNNGSSIVLSGGLTSADVIFNIVGNGGGGAQLNNGSTVYGNIISTSQQVQINNHSLLVGAVISNGIQVNNGAEIESPGN